MKSIRLEQEDSYLKSFQSMVIAVKNNWIALKESAFYPTAGGQLFDTGTLNGISVLDVEKHEDAVWHKLEFASLAVGDAVKGTIDWDRRFRHMQRHSAQHMLSQAFFRLNAAFETQSVSLTSNTCSIDFSGNPQADDLLAAEKLVNEMLYKNLSIKSFEIDDTDVSNYPLRRPPKVKGRVRLVQMGDWEFSACGGTHLRQSSEAAPLKIMKSERIRSNLTRVFFKVGLEALHDYSEKHSISQTLSQNLSTNIEQIVPQIEKLQQDLKDVKHHINEHNEEKARVLAEKLLEKAELIGNVKVIKHIIYEQALVNPLAKRLNQKNGTIVLLIALANERTHLLFTRSANVEQNMNDVLQHVLPVIGGRGGGKPDRAQGSGTHTENTLEALNKAFKFVEAKLL